MNPFVFVLLLQVFGQTNALKEPCIFEAPEVEEGLITRVQEYTPPFDLCGLKYLGKVTVVEGGERYLAFITPETKIYDVDGTVIPVEKTVERLKKNDCDYIFKKRVRSKPEKLDRQTGLLVELRIRKN